jgi:poly-gamma-glutamate synthesis protein (capsule biosynthesis protein)
MKICREWMDAGADVVYGSQAHQVQQIEFYKNKPIFYGLGNFLFDQVHRIGVRQGFFLHYYFYKGKLIQIQPVYTYTTDDRRPSIATKEQSSAIKKAIFKDEWLYKN